MKKPFLLFIFLVVGFFNSQGQNLVPNSGFEQYISCPYAQAQLDSALFWTSPAMPYGSPDYFNSCTSSPNVDVPDNFPGYQYAHSGNAYSGIITYFPVFFNYREYIEVPFTMPLITGVCYYFEMYVSIADRNKYSTYEIGIYFSDTLVIGINNWDPLPFNPQIIGLIGNPSDTINWLLVNGNYTASGGENFLIIGNFKNDSNTNAITINNNAPLSASWIYFYIDDVSLSPCTGIEEQNQNDAITIYPNPVKDELKISGVKFKVGEKAEIRITDILGKEILRKQFLTPDLRLPTSHFNSGIYFFEINNGKHVYRKKFLKESFK